MTWLEASCALSLFLDLNSSLLNSSHYKPWLMLSPLRNNPSRGRHSIFHYFRLNFLADSSRDFAGSFKLSVLTASFLHLASSIGSLSAAMNAARFPNMNQTRHWYVRSRVTFDSQSDGPAHSFQNYIDYHKCIKAKGDEFAPCKQFLRAYRSLCPSESVIMLTIFVAKSSQISASILDEWVRRYLSLWSSFKA